MVDLTLNLCTFLVLPTTFFPSRQFSMNMLLIQPLLSAVTLHVQGVTQGLVNDCQVSSLFPFFVIRVLQRTAYQMCRAFTFCQENFHYKYTYISYIAVFSVISSTPWPFKIKQNKVIIALQTDSLSFPISSVLTYSGHKMKDLNVALHSDKPTGSSCLPLCFIAWLRLKSLLVLFPEVPDPLKLCYTAQGNVPVHYPSGNTCNRR